MIATLIFVVSVVAVLLVALFFQKRIADREITRHLRATMQRAIAAETEKRKAEATRETQKKIADVPNMTDAELETEINK